MNAEGYLMNAPETSSPGTLYLVATPIGNLNDITFRAIETLKKVDLILAEDTRQTLKLLAVYSIKNPLQAFHAHNEQHKMKDILAVLASGKNIALVSDAGTPTINDPGFLLVQAAKQESYRVVPIPGACALIAALCASGVSTDIFTFAGFLPAKKEARRQKLQALAEIPHTVIVYESTHRILGSIEAIQEVFGVDSPLVLAKELTKSHETILSDQCSTILAWLKADEARIKGEFVLIFPPRAVSAKPREDAILSQLLEVLPLKKAVQLTHSITGVNKNKLYQDALLLKGDISS